MNKDNYKKAINQIHAKEELKEKTFERINPATKKRKILLPYKKFLAACAVVAIVFATSAVYLENEQKNLNELVIDKNTAVAKVKNDLPRFENIEQLKEVLKEHNNYYDDMLITDSANTNGEIPIPTGSTSGTTSTGSTSSKEESKVQNEVAQDYSKTNVQVDNVDEADIVKTDGKYIYYVANNSVYIIEASNLEIISEIKIEESKEKLNIREIFINKDKLIVLGNSVKYETRKSEDIIDLVESLVDYSYAKVEYSSMAKAIVYDISDKANPKQVRQVGLDGYYQNARMIGDNIYFISTKSAYYYTGMKESEILPATLDTITGANEEKAVAVTDIAYFKDTDSYSYMLVAGFNIMGKQPANIETFFGANGTVYASEENLYIAETNYDYRNSTSTIYKFNLDGSQIALQCKGEIKGNLNNQFSMDEYEGNLRIATTEGYDEEATNQLYVLDENLKEIGKIEDLAKGERIYSVRFIGKVGYIVTFEQIDPLFVIDLEDPKNPQVKGELKIPGYSSYLHPYDETHIIGIGYNTKSNGHGGVTNSSMKMSMFDVSDLENPKEMFNISIGGTSYTYSELQHNHKALFYNKDKNLIGFPVEYRKEKTSKYVDSFKLFRIDLENGFEEAGEIEHARNYYSDIERAIYIQDTLYTLTDEDITSYSLDTLEKIKTLELD